MKVTQSVSHLTVKSLKYGNNNAVAIIKFIFSS
jgi:hypothetical protein